MGPAMFRRGIVFVGLSVPIAGACNSTPTSTVPFRASHTGLVVGRVEFPDGTPMESAAVFVTVPSTPLYGYAAQPVISNARGGESPYVVERLASPPQVPSPDAASAEVAVSLLATRYRLPGNVVPTLNDTVLVTFLPRGRTPPAAISNFVFQR